MTASVVGYMMRTALHNNRKLQEEHTKHKGSTSCGVDCYLDRERTLTALFEFHPDFTFTLVLSAAQHNYSFLLLISVQLPCISYKKHAQA